MALSHLPQPRSCLQICRLRFQSVRRCRLSVCSNDENDNPPQLKKEADNPPQLKKEADNPPQLKKEAAAEETGGVAAEPFVEESSKKIPNLFSSMNELARRGSKKIQTLTDIFREDKDDQTATMAENEETKPEETMAENEGKKTEEALAGVLLNFVKHKKTQFEYPSPASVSDDNHLGKFLSNRCENDLLEYQNIRREGGETNSPSESIQKTLDLKDCYEKSPDDRQAARELVKPRSPILSHQPFEHSHEPHSKDAENSFHIQGLVDFLRLHNDVPSNATGNTGLIKDNTSDGNSRIGDGETSSLDFHSRDGTELNARIEASVSPSNKEKKKSKKTHIAKKLSEENKVLVRFLPRSFNESHTLNFFGSCGEILKVEFPYAEGQPLFKVAYIYFKTREGLEEAIKKSGLVINKTIVTVESATSMDTTVKSPIPSLLGDPDVPTALVKNPTRTIKIEQLTHDVSSRHIEEALAFCESKVTGYYLGTSHSVAYVEFETEIGKERALAKQSIDVFGRHLVMLRIDSPRTTVVRISNVEDLEFQSRHVHYICRSLGDVKCFIGRSKDILDVYFRISEWPNMWKILNGLNGTVVEDRQLQAEPAPIYPSEVLLALWHQPEERKHLKATAQNLLGKIVGDKRADISAYTSLQNLFVDGIWGKNL